MSKLDNVGYLTVHAIRNIAANQEILVNSAEVEVALKSIKDLREA